MSSIRPASASGPTRWAGIRSPAARIPKSPSIEPVRSTPPPAVHRASSTPTTSSPTTRQSTVATCTPRRSPVATSPPSGSGSTRRRATTHPCLRDSPVAPEWADDLEAITGMHDQAVSNVFSGARRAYDCLADPRVLRAANPARRPDSARLESSRKMRRSSSSARRRASKHGADHHRAHRDHRQRGQGAKPRARRPDGSRLRSVSSSTSAPTSRRCRRCPNS